MFKRWVCVLLTLCLLPFGVLAWDAEADWSGAYYDFIILDGCRETGRSYSSSEEYPLRFTLYDLDGDGVPELFLRDPMRAMAEEPYDVYTYRSGGVAYIGRMGIRGGELHYAPGSGCPGLFSYDGNMGFYMADYYIMDRGAILSQRVVETVLSDDGTPTDTQITADDRLMAAFRRAYDGSALAYTDHGALPACSREEISDMGWETFVDGMAGAARFYDVGVTAYYAGPVAWAAETGITQGTAADLFSPQSGCTRAQMVTVLWRAAGMPEPTGSERPFGDVAPGAYYETAVRWAVETGVTQGTQPGRFSPDAAVTRAQTVTFLWRLAGEPEGGETGNPFLDVPPEQYYAPAVRWAAETGVTQGTAPETFDPGLTVTRAQAVTFLYRADCGTVGTQTVPPSD